MPIEEGVEYASNGITQKDSEGLRSTQKDSEGLRGTMNGSKQLHVPRRAGTTTSCPGLKQLITVPVQ